MQQLVCPLSTSILLGPILLLLLYLQADDHGSESLSHLISLFVERSHQLWKAADVQAWLKTAAEAAADVADGKHINPAAAAAAGLSSSAVKPDDIVVEGSADDWACVARETFPASGRNEYGHLRLSDFSDTVNALPQEEMQAALAAAAGRGPAAQGQVGVVCWFVGHIFWAFHCGAGELRGPEWTAVTARHGSMQMGAAVEASSICQHLCSDMMIGYSWDSLQYLQYNRREANQPAFSVAGLLTWCMSPMT